MKYISLSAGVEKTKNSECFKSTLQSIDGILIIRLRFASTKTQVIQCDGRAPWGGTRGRMREFEEGQLSCFLTWTSSPSNHFIPQATQRPSKLRSSTTKMISQKCAFRTIQNGEQGADWKIKQTNFQKVRVHSWIDLVSFFLFVHFLVNSTNHWTFLVFEIGHQFNGKSEVFPLAKSRQKGLLQKIHFVGELSACDNHEISHQSNNWNKWLICKRIFFA